MFNPGIEMSDALLRILVRLLNGIITASFFLPLIQLYLKNRRRFYLNWSTGFLLYGINIIIRAVMDYNPKPYRDSFIWIIFIFYFLGFSNIIIGIGELLGRPKLAFAYSFLLLIIPVLINMLPNGISLMWTISLSPYALISLSLIFIKRNYGESLDLFIVGWVLLLIINIAMPLEMMNPVYIDLVAILAKLIIFQGMMSPRFSLLADNMKQFLLTGFPEVYPSNTSEHIIMILPNESQRENEVEWISHHVTDNSKHGIRTVLVTLYDLITPSQLEAKGLHRDDIYLVRLMPKGDRVMQSIGDRVAVMSDELTRLKMLISEIIDFSNERQIHCNIIIYSLSWAIHTHGEEEVYSLILEKTPDLKASFVQVYFFFYPDTHEEVEVAKFKRLADKIITI
jgi:hypothetical protein